MRFIHFLFFILLILPLITINSFAQGVLNLYAWTGEVPDATVRQFEKETGIKVNFSTYENNEIMYAKLRASKNPGYDVIMPSSYYVDRMAKQGLLNPLDKNLLTLFKNIDPLFANPPYDPKSTYSVPFIWGVTGIFANKNYFQTNTILAWNNLWEKRFYNQLLILDDTREVFSTALISLGYPANDQNPEHIKAAYLKLKELIANIKVFSTDTVVSILIDEDATVGMAWNGDVYKASHDNPNVDFIFPQDGFVIWIDNFCIPKSAPHKKEAYLFINFMLRADVARDVSLATYYPVANNAARALLPKAVAQNTVIYPPKNILAKGQFQTDVSDATLALYEQYWNDLKMGA